MSTSKQALASIAITLALALVVTVAIKLNPPIPEEAIPVAADGACDLQRGACAARLPGGGQLEFAIEPRPIPVLKPIQLRVRLEQLRARSVEVHFSGTTMNMGLNQAVLRPEAPGVFAGEATLPVCVRDRMGWRATVLVTTADARFSIPFLFETVRE